VADEDGVVFVVMAASAVAMLDGDLGEEGGTDGVLVKDSIVLIVMAG